MPRARSSGSRSVSRPVSARTSAVLPWSMCPAVPTVSGGAPLTVAGVRRTERRRSRTFPPRGCRGSPALKAGWATGPGPLHVSRCRSAHHADGAGSAVDQAPDDGARHVRGALGRDRDQQAARRGGVADQPAAPFLDVGREARERLGVLAVAPAAAGHRVVAAQQRLDALDAPARPRRRPPPRGRSPRSSSRRCPSSPKPVTSVIACAPAARAARDAVGVQRGHRRDGGRRAAPSPRPRLSAVEIAPTPSGLVSTSTSPARPPALLSTRAGSTVPVTARPYFGSGRRSSARRRAARRPRARRRRRRAGSRRSTSGPSRSSGNATRFSALSGSAAHRVDVATARWPPRCARSRTGRRRSA